MTNYCNNDTAAADLQLDFPVNITTPQYRAGMSLPQYGNMSSNLQFRIRVEQ
jgi:hypothetical protein